MLAGLSCLYFGLHFLFLVCRSGFTRSHLCVVIMVNGLMLTWQGSCLVQLCCRNLPGTPGSDRRTQMLVGFGQSQTLNVECKILCMEPHDG